VKLKINNQIQNVFAEVVANHEMPSYVMQICQLIKDDDLYWDKVAAILSQNNIPKITDVKEQILDLLLFYIKAALKDDAITEDEAKNVTLLKRFFKIKEGDFFRYRLSEIKSILNVQFRKIYIDNYITENEALHKVNLQDLFDLGYDQFLSLIDGEIKDALLRGGELQNLDTFLRQQK
jgi:hypothetical protein